MSRLSLSVAAFSNDVHANCNYLSDYVNSNLMQNWTWNWIPWIVYRVGVTVCLREIDVGGFEVWWIGTFGSYSFKVILRT